MTHAPVPAWVRAWLAAPTPRRAAAARAVLAAGRPWDELRRAIAAALLVDPAACREALPALVAAARKGSDRALGARLRALEGRAHHRAGRLDDALDAYADAERGLRAARLAAEAQALGVARVDALATAGRVRAALALGARLARALPSPPPTALAASLAVNRGNALRLDGRLEEAVEAYEGAARDLDALGNAYASAVARLNAGVALLEAGEVEAGRAAFAASAEAFRARALVDLEREARANLAWADLHAGRLGAAIRALDSLASEHRTAGLARREAVCRMDLADALRRAGDAAGAEREALRAAHGFSSAGARAERVEALWAAAAAAADRDRPAAWRHAREARRAARAVGREALALRCDLLLADLAAAAGRLPSAASLDALARRARALRAPSAVADAALLAGDAAWARGRAARARFHFARAAAAGRGRPWTRVAAETGLARAEARTPAGVRSGVARLRRVTRFLDAVRSDLPGAWLRASFVARRLDPWVALVDLLLARGRGVDRREAARILDGVAARRVLAARPPGGDAVLARARARLEALYDRLARGEGPVRGADGLAGDPAVLERRARAWERAVAQAWRRMERSAPRGDPERALPSAAALPAGTALLNLWRRGDRLCALLRTEHGVGAGIDLGPVEAVEALAESLRLRARRWALLRARDPRGADPRAFEAVLERLASVLAPLAPAAWPAEVSVVADPSLPDLPWELLPTRDGRLGATHRLLRVPSPLATPAPRPRGEGTVVVGVGEPDLPAVAEEVEAAARAAGGARILVGPAATRAAVAEALRTARTVHLAGHGWEVASAPPLGGVRVADGWFTAADLPPEGVGADLVVLAACRTGAPSGPAALAWGGLVPALLAAGARRVVWTADDVDDAAAARLTTLFHGLRSTLDDRAAFGSALARAALAEGHAGAVFPFRLSGVLA